MGHVIYKIGDDLYMEWSTIVDAPSTTEPFRSRAELEKWLFDEYVPRCDRRGRVGEIQREMISMRINKVDEGFSSGGVYRSIAEVCDHIVVRYNEVHRTNFKSVMEIYESLKPADDDVNDTIVMSPDGRSHVIKRINHYLRKNMTPPSQPMPPEGTFLPDAENLVLIIEDEEWWG